MLRIKHFLIIALSIPLLVISCEEEQKKAPDNKNQNIRELYKANQTKISIVQGVSGTLIMKEGNCMPMIGPYEGENPCRSYPVERTIQVYEPTSGSQVESSRPGPTYEEIHTKLIAETESDEDGFYQLAIDTGRYSIFIIEKGKYYRNMFKDNLIGPATVEVDSVSIENLTIDYAAY